MSAEELLFEIRGGDLARVFATSATNFSTPSERVGPGRIELTVTPVPDVSLGQAAGQRQLHGLGHAVVDHLHGNVHGRFARDENDAPPSGSLHLRQPIAAQPHAAHEIDLDEGAPIGVGDLLEGLDFVSAQVVNQDIHIRESFQGGITPRRRRERSATRPSRRAAGWSRRIASSAVTTRASVRPFTTTRAPSAASPLAMAKPIPAVEPVTSASLPSSCRFMACS